MSNAPTKHDYELTFDRLHEAHGTHLRAAHEALDRALAQAEANDAQFDTFATENPVWKTQTDAMRTNRGELRGQLMRVKECLDALDSAFEESTHTYRPEDADDRPTEATHRQTGPDDPSHPMNWRAAKDQVPSDATKAEMKREGKDTPSGDTHRQTGVKDPDDPNTWKANDPKAPQAKVIPEEPTENPTRRNEMPGGAPKPLDRPENKPKR